MTFQGRRKKSQRTSKTISERPLKIRPCELFMIFLCWCKGPVTLLRMRETYEKRMKINAIIFIRTTIL